MAITTEDRVEIRDLYDRFYMALNEGDTDTIRAAFAPGGTVTRYGGDTVSSEGPAQTGQKWSKDPVGQTYQHHVTNVVVDPDPDGDENTCRVRMYFFMTGVWEPPHTIIRWSCKSTDLLKRVDGKWGFWDRRITLNHDATGPHWDNEPTHADAS